MPKRRGLAPASHGDDRPCLMRQVTAPRSGVTNRLTTHDQTTMRKKSTAYDPIERIDVEIDCRDVHVDDSWDAIDGSELPVIVASDFRHDPVEACQGSYTAINEIEGGCPNCGYDRMNVSVQTLAGVHREECRACGVDITDRNRDDWEPTQPFSPVEEMKRHAEYVGKTNRHGSTLYRRNDRGLYALVTGDGRSTSLYDEEVLTILRLILNDDESDLTFSSFEARRLIVDILDVTETEEDDDE